MSMLELFAQPWSQNCLQAKHADTSTMTKRAEFSDYYFQSHMAELPRAWDIHRDLPRATMFAQWTDAFSLQSNPHCIIIMTIVLYCKASIESPFEVVHCSMHP
jgi:hypothetical protein